MTRVVMFSRYWLDSDNDERGYVARSIAGAIPYKVDVLAPCIGSYPDGAFDIFGAGSNQTWEQDQIPLSFSTNAAPRFVVVDCRDPEEIEIARSVFSNPIIVSYGPCGLGVTKVATDVDATLFLDPRSKNKEGVFQVGFSVPIKTPKGIEHHNAISNLTYLLVLSEEKSPSNQPIGSRLGPWIVAKYTNHHVVILKDATAQIFLNRCLIGEFHVDTRADLWRIMAHATAVIDLSPGPLVARESIEASRLGVPVIAKEKTPAELISDLTFANTKELFLKIDLVCNPSRRSALGLQAKSTADRYFGDPVGFCKKVRLATEALIDDRG